MFKNLQSVRYLDRKTQAEIISLISELDKTKITQQNIHLLLKFALRVVLFDTSAISLQFCWGILEEIQSSKLPLEPFISPQLVRDVLQLIKESPEVLKIVTWILNNTDSEDIRMAVKQKVVEMVGPTGSNTQYTLEHLNTIIQRLTILTNQPELMPQDTDLEELCTNVVLTLGQFQMPKDAHSIAVFVNNVERIKDFLHVIYEMKPNEIRFAMLSALYKSISESKSDAGPGLVVVLQLIEENYIVEAVRWLLAPKHDDSSLVRGLNVLVGWLFQWTRNPQLDRWVIAFMNGLRAQKRFSVLEQVTLERIPKMISMLRLPLYRSSISAVLFHMLCATQHSPTAFLLAVDEFPSVIEILRRENSDTSRQCLQSIVDICTALMEHYPHHQHEYEKLRKAIQDETPSENYRDVLNVPTWSDGTEQQIVAHNVPGKVGLVNLGNTCYMNSVLQALYMTLMFRNDILSCPHLVKPIDGLQTLFALLQFSKRSALHPPDNLLTVRPPGFVPGLQHDSSEYMGYLLDMLHEQEKSQMIRYNGNDSGGCSAQSSPITIVQRIFGGQAKTTYRCETCNGESIQNDPFRDLQLSFPANNLNRDNSVQALLEFYLEPEKLCDENRYWCDRCEALSNAERVLQVTQAPKNLILTLKHFRYDPKLQQRAKLFQRVCYDQFIKLNQFQYELYAAVVHSGPSVDSGHYYTYARDNLGIWYKFNDSWVSRSSFTELSSLQQPATPYLLFYQKQVQDSTPTQPLPFEALSPSLQTVVKRDLASFAAENRRRTNSIHRSPSPITRKSPDDDDDDDPPPFCGGGGGGGGACGDFSSNAGRFVY